MWSIFLWYEYSTKTTIINVIICWWGVSAPSAMVTWKWQIVSFLVGQNGCARLPLLLSGWYIHLKTVGNILIFTPLLAAVVVCKHNIQSNYLGRISIIYQ